ncbi:MAG TPA: hypothetical protein VM733_18305 [Thermoanaerobaculia bacterium]|nr:hypothetical protein [Thermoanaerobaculia bacterium]
MPVRKFRSIDEWQNAKDEQWLDCNDPRVAQRIRDHWNRWSRLVPLGIPAGVRKYRSAEEAEAERDEWESARMSRIRALRKQ